MSTASFMMVAALWLATVANVHPDKVFLAASAVALIIILDSSYAHLWFAVRDFLGLDSWVFVHQLDEERVTVGTVQDSLTSMKKLSSEFPSVVGYLKTRGLFRRFIPRQ